MHSCVCVIRPKRVLNPCQSSDCPLPFDKKISFIIRLIECTQKTAADPNRFCYFRHFAHPTTAKEQFVCIFLVKKCPPPSVLKALLYWLNEIVKECPPFQSVSPLFKCPTRVPCRSTQPTFRVRAFYVSAFSEEISGTYSERTRWIYT